MSALGDNGFTGTNWSFLPLKPGQIASSESQSFLRNGVVVTDIPFTPTGGISSTTVQGAIIELDSEKADKPIAPQTLSASAVISSGEVKFIGSTVGQTLTLPSLPAGTVVSIRNASSVSILIAPGPGTTIENASSFTLYQDESITVIRFTNDWTIR